MDEQQIWEKARPIDGLNPDMFRKDACGALIMRDKLNKHNPFGWVIDHIFPVSRGGGDDIDNLRPLHYENNKMKDNDYPSYTAKVRFNGSDNIIDERNLTINTETRKKLKELYADA